MLALDFAFWLQGMFELTDPETLNAAQTNLIKRHLELVFKHDIDPSAGDAQTQQELNSIHHGPIGGVGPGGEVYRC